jgi:hypothetical protein
VELMMEIIMATEDNDSLPTADRRFPGKTVSLQKPREYQIGPTRGPFAKSLGRTGVKVLAEITRGSFEDKVR